MTLLIIVITAITSFLAFNNSELLQKFVFTPYIVARNKEYYRFFSSGLIHANLVHLLLNLYVLYIFGTGVEHAFKAIMSSVGNTLYLGMYILAIGFSELYSFYKHRDNPRYSSLGASGAVSAVVFASILIDPMRGIGLIIIPGVYIPGVIAGVLYLVYSAYMSKKNADNIGHNAHFYGALFGFIFPLFFEPQLFIAFLSQILNSL